MKSILLIGAMILFAFTNAFSQGFWLNAGYNYSTLHNYDDTYQWYDQIEGSTKPVSGFHVSLSYELPGSNTFYTETGLTFSSKGFSHDLFSTTSDPLY